MFQCDSSDDSWVAARMTAAAPGFAAALTGPAPALRHCRQRRPQWTRRAPFVSFKPRNANSSVDLDSRSVPWWDIPSSCRLSAATCALRRQSMISEPPLLVSSSEKQVRPGCRLHPEEPGSSRRSRGARRADVSAPPAAAAMSQPPTDEPWGARVVQAIDSGAGLRCTPN